MGKQQDWSVAAFVFLFLSLTSQINRAYASKRGISSVSVPSPKSGVNQKELDLINNLPGQPPVNFKQYGGYVAINETAGRYFYYYFVEAMKANASSPLVVYLEGGPLCSSLAGALSMFGPFAVHNDRKTLFQNPYSWNNEANLLYIESPADVGFSYTNTQSDVENQGDKMTAEDNYTFLVKWLERFPEYKGRDFYITGESYAGHYVPQLSQIILQRNKKTVINLRGILLGNPLLDRRTEESVKNEYLLGHALISQEHFDEEKKFCVDPLSEKCSTAKNNIKALIKGLGLYNIYATSCSLFRKNSKPKEHSTEFDPCRGPYMEAYLSIDKVQAAMHANATKLQYGWSICSNGHFKDTDTFAPMQPILHELISKNIRIWVYNGDLDAIVSTTATQAVLQSMKLTVERRWRVWFSDEEVGGYTQEYKGNFVYATVRGAGHNVPTDQPKRALTLFTNFLHNTALPSPPPPASREMIFPH